MDTMPEKCCRKCHVRQSYDNFPLGGLYGTTHSWVCHTCTELKEQEKELQKQASRKLARRSLEKSYGLPPGRYEQMLEAQKHCCAICQRHEDILPINRYSSRKLAIDHSHTTGQVRGLLCTSCNWALGRFQDSIPTLRRAIQYLRSHPDIVNDGSCQLSLLPYQSEPPIFVPPPTTPRKEKPLPVLEPQLKRQPTQPSRPKRPQPIQCSSPPQPQEPRPQPPEFYERITEAVKTLKAIKARTKSEKEHNMQ